MQGEELFATIFILGMFSGVFIVYMGLRQRSQQMEMQHRERMAMIERGQIPLSEPSGMLPELRRMRAAVPPSTRSLSLGIIVVGLGIALMTIIGIAGESPEVGVGVGGAIAVLGAAFIVRSLVVRPATAPPDFRNYPAQAPPAAHEPPASDGRDI
jgi:hypothetical protein